MPSRNRDGPVDRVRAALRERLGDRVADGLPDGYQRLGRVVVLRLPEELRGSFAEIGRTYQEELRVETVLRRSGPIGGEERHPSVERLTGGPTETEVIEHGIRYRLDAARIMFAAGNRTERQRIGRLVRPGETVLDLFAGIGYFAIPAAVIGHASRVVCCERNPVAVHYLRENARINGVERSIDVIPGDNRAAPLGRVEADRVILGYLPSSLPWVPLAMSALPPSGGWLHVHFVVGVREGLASAEAIARAAVREQGGTLEEARVREVKPYGPGNRHVVVDVRAVPDAGARAASHPP